MVKPAIKVLKPNGN